MAKTPKEMDSKLVGQHKRLAMGEKVTGMKNGGAVCMKKGGEVKAMAKKKKK